MCYIRQKLDYNEVFYALVPQEMGFYELMLEKKLKKQFLNKKSTPTKSLVHQGEEKAHYDGCDVLQRHYAEVVEHSGYLKRERLLLFD